MNLNDGDAGIAGDGVRAQAPQLETVMHLLDGYREET